MTLKDIVNAAICSMFNQVKLLMKRFIPFAEIVDKTTSFNLRQLKANSQPPNDKESDDEAIPQHTPETHDEVIPLMSDKKAEIQAAPPGIFFYRNVGDICDRCHVIRCGHCGHMHEFGRCFATGRHCHVCGGVGHYKYACPVLKKKK